MRLIHVVGLALVASVLVGSTSNAERLEARRSAIETAATLYYDVHHQCPSVGDLRRTKMMRGLRDSDALNFVIACDHDVTAAIRNHDGCL